jgi:5-formyltetrahydrofolate cyclo-ligase
VADAAWNVIDSHPVRTLLAYAALSGEPNLDPAIDRFLAAGGTVYLPVVTKVGEPLAFGQVIGSMSSLEPQGKWGIREPQDSSQPLSADELLSPEIGLDLIFVPALGFGADGARLGNGGGFYDRTFGPQGAAPLGSASPEHVSSSADHDESTPPTHGSASPTDGPRVVGVCFAEELALPGLVAEDWDLRIPAAVTENGLHTFATS